MSFNGAKDGKHYWLTPPDLMAELQAEFDFNFDPCPYPKPDDFDGLTDEWGERNYVNPPFGAIVYPDGKKRGATAWARKCLQEWEKGKLVVMVYPIDKWVLMLLDAGAKVRNLRDVQWIATEDASAHKGTGRHIAMFTLDPVRNLTPFPKKPSCELSQCLSAHAGFFGEGMARAPGVIAADVCHVCGTTYATRALYCHNCGTRR